MSKKQQKINCNVSSCKYNNCRDDECTLEAIKVSCDFGCDKDAVNKKSETVCNSFKKTAEKE